MRGASHVFDELLRAGDDSAVTAQGLARRGDKESRPTAVGGEQSDTYRRSPRAVEQSEMLKRPAAVRTQHADAVGVVQQQGGAGVTAQHRSIVGRRRNRAASSRTRRRSCTSGRWPGRRFLRGCRPDRRRRDDGNGTRRTGPLPGRVEHAIVRKLVHQQRVEAGRPIACSRIVPPA